MYRPVEVCESLTPAGETGKRYIVFSSIAYGKTIMKSFGNGYSTMILDGKLYDWYGREVVVNDICAEVIMPFGFETITAVCPNYRTRVIESYDRYIVRLIDGSYALSAVWKTVNHQVEKPANSSLLDYPIPRWCLTRALPEVRFDKLISAEETARENPGCNSGSITMVVYDSVPTTKEQKDKTGFCRSIVVSPEDPTTLIYSNLTR